MMLDTTTTTSTAHIAQNKPLSMPGLLAKVNMAAAPSIASTGLEFIYDLLVGGCGRSRFSGRSRIGESLRRGGGGGASR